MNKPFEIIANLIVLATDYGVNSGFSYLPWLIGLIIIIIGSILIFFQETIIFWYKARKEKLGVSFMEINKLLSAHLPVKEFFKVLSECKKHDIPINLEEVQHLHLRKVKFDSFVKMMLKAKEPELNIGIKYLKKFYLYNDNVEEILDATIELKENGIEVTLENVAELSTETNRLDSLVHSLKTLKNAGIEIPVAELVEDHIYSNHNIVQLILSYHRSLTHKLNIPFDEFMSHTMARGNISKLIDALIKAKNAKLGVTFGDLADIDLSGHDVNEAVENAIVPRMIELDGIKGVTKDRYPIAAKAYITVRTRLSDLIVGAKEETLLIRIKEALSSAIGTCKTHTEIFENPNKASALVMERQLDVGTSLKLESINLADVHIGKEIDADLKIMRAEYQKVIFKADSERRKLLADVSAQEARVEIKKAEARIKQAEAKLREAEAKIREMDAKSKRQKTERNASNNEGELH